MLFSRIVYASLLVGLLSALVLSAVQQWQVAPIIFAAEAYEGAEYTPTLAAEEADGHSHEHGHHDHSHGEEWAPADGAERLFYSLMSNLFAGIGFSLVLMAIMSQLQLRGMINLTPAKGILWGFAGFVAVFAAPAIGLPPEIPGIEAPPVEYRQIWWLLTVALTGAGIAVLIFASIRYKVAGLALMLLPHIIGAPMISGAEFKHPDPVVVAELTSLHHEFITISAVANLLFWLVIGLASSWAVSRWIVKHDVVET
ncbi:Uncharacterised protein [BD1-7 clade bacterium]|uniref:Cobalt transporter subunit CbtA n=1 Tax=BD1-7 clade bacterium TaxID=2029982 RepID=A0A5S9P777_9GAMM|nr:Uncharacterised protein [BD1-7 clade bacterium]